MIGRAGAGGAEPLQDRALHRAGGGARQQRAHPPRPRLPRAGGVHDAGQHLHHQGGLGRVGLPEEVSWELREQVNHFLTPGFQEHLPHAHHGHHPDRAGLPALAPPRGRLRRAGARPAAGLQGLLLPQRERGQPRAAGGAVRLEERHRPHPRHHGEEHHPGPGPQPRRHPRRQGHHRRDRHLQRKTHPDKSQLDENPGLLKLQKKY